AAIEDAKQRLFDDLPSLFTVTSIRSGWIGGGFSGSPSLPRQMATAAGIRGAGLMPATAELFLGFTSTVKPALGPPKIANLETLGYAHLRSRYFVGGTHMHLSHLAENLNAWYLNFDHADRVHAMFRPGLASEQSAQTIPQAADDIETTSELRAD